METEHRTREYLTLDEAADRLRLSRATLYQPEWKARLRVVKVGHRLLVPVAAVDSVLNPSPIGG